MTLIPIEPVVVPAVPEKIYSTLWLRTLVVEAPTPTSEGKISLEWLPMATDGSVLDKPSWVRSDNLFQLCAAVPEMGAAMAAVMAAILPLKAYLKQLETQEDEQGDQQ